MAGARFTDDPATRIAGDARARLGALLWSAPSTSPGIRLVELALAGGGFVGGLAALSPLLGLGGVALLAGLFTACLLGASQLRPGAAATTLRWGSRAVIAVVLAFFGYEALAFGSMLAWAVPWWTTALVGALLMASLASHASPRGKPRVALVVPLGAWIGACLLGWVGDIGTARCDDYRRVVAQRSVEIVVESATALGSCEEGERVSPTGHPRKLFAEGTAGAFFATVQRTESEHGDPTSTFRGGLCAVSLPPAGAASVACRDDLPSLYALAVLPRRGELLIGGSVGLARLSARPPFETLAQAPEGRYVSTLVHVPELGSAEVLAFYDDMDRAERFDLESLRRVESRVLPIAPEEVRYDAARREGIYCSASAPLFPIEGQPYLALAVGADLSDVRLLGRDVPWAWLAFSDGCDVDLDARRAYVGVGTLGLVAVLDYDSGELLETHSVGFGVRPLLLDAGRQRLYAGNYLDGWVRELDAISGAPLRRWFVGRFVRHIVPDGDALLVTSTLGIVRIDRAEERVSG